MFRDLGSFIEHRDAAGELVRVKKKLSTRYESPVAIKYVAQKKGAVVCEKGEG